MTNKEILELRLNGNKIKDIAATAKMTELAVNLAICDEIDSMVAKTVRIEKKEVGLI